MFYNHKPLSKSKARRRCATKRKYDTKKEAWASARNHDTVMLAYQCKVCGGWHLATKGKKGKIRNGSWNGYGAF